MLAYARAFPAWMVVAVIALASTVGALFVVTAGCGAGPGAESAWSRTLRTGELKWGADPKGGAPFVFNDPKDPNTIIGFEIDMIDAIAKHLGVKPVMVTAEWDALLEDLVVARRSDMVMNGIEINEVRQRRVAFSDPYYIYEQQLTIRKADKEKYKSLEDLKGQTVATLAGAEANNVLLRAGWDAGKIKTFDDSSNPYADLVNGRVEAVLQEGIIAEYYATPMPELYNIPTMFAPGKYAVAFRPDDTELLAQVNQALAKMKANGELAAIYKKWNMWNDKQKELGIKEDAAPAATATTE